MDSIFSQIMNRAFAGTLLILAACLYRIVFPKAPKWSRLLLWALAALRLILPFSIKSALSLVPSEKVLDYQTAQYAAKPTITSGIASLNRAVNPSFGESFAATPQGSVNPLQVFMYAAGVIWAIGMAAMLFWALVSFLRLRRRVQASIEEVKGVRICDAIDTPFLLGLFRPIIYLPSDLPEEERSFVLAHERAHLRHGDCVWKLLGFLILCVYWFDPLVWLGYTLFCRDLELACDERVVKTYSLAEKKRYASVLLSCSVPKKQLSACPLAFGEVGVKERVKRVLDKKPAKIAVALALALCLVIGVCFLTSPKDSVIYGLSSGTYIMDTSSDQNVPLSFMSPRVIFRMSEGKHEFVFVDSLLSSYLITGEFTIEDGVVACENGRYTPVFKILDNDTIVLQMPDQEGLQTNLVFIPNGTEFHYEAPDESRMTFYQQEAGTGEARADFLLSFGEKISGGEVWAELWQDGQCLESQPLALSKADGDLHLAFRYALGDPKEALSVQLSMQAQTAEQVQTNFTLPEGIQAIGFHAYEDGTELPLREGEELVLASLVPDLGNGALLYDCTELAARPELYQQASCMIVVKAAFSTIPSIE